MAKKRVQITITKDNALGIAAHYLERSVVNMDIAMECLNYYGVGEEVELDDYKIVDASTTLLQDLAAKLNQIQDNKEAP